MRIDRLELQNFRCFDHFALDLHPEFNVLIGENGAGKSAVLDAMAVAMGAWFLGIKSGGTPRPILPLDVRSLGGRDKANGRKTIFEPQYPVAVRADGHAGNSMDRHGWNCVLAGEGNDTSTTGAFTLSEAAAKLDREVRALKPSLLPVLAYYRANRLGLWSTPTEKHEPFDQRDLSRFEGYRDSLDPNTSALQEWLGYEDRVAYSSGEPSATVMSILTAMRQMLAGASDIRFDPGRLEVVVEFEAGSVIPLAQLSDGQRNMLSLAGDLAMRMARLNPQLGENVLAETPGVVLIDELDLHLHPRWQRHIVADLRRTFPRVQFVTTTHSPLILSEVEPASITVLTKAGDSFSAYKPSQSYGLDVDDLLMRLMGTRGRPEAVQSLIDTVDDALEEGDLGLARDRVDELRERIHGDDPEVVRLDTSIYALEALSNAVD